MLQKILEFGDGSRQLLMPCTITCENLIMATSVCLYPDVFFISPKYFWVMQLGLEKQNRPTYPILPLQYPCYRNHTSFLFWPYHPITYLESLMVLHRNIQKRQNKDVSCSLCIISEICICFIYSHPRVKKIDWCLDFQIPQSELQICHLTWKNHHW